MFDSEILGLFFNSLPDALLICQSNGIILRSNKQVKEILGYEDDELIGNTVEMLIPAEFRESHRHLRKFYNKNPKPRSMEAPISLKARKKDQSELPVSISLSPTTLDAQEMIIVCIRDNSPLVNAQLREKRIEDKINQTQKLESLGVMAAGISHDFNNLLHVILGNIDIAESSLPAHSETLENLNNMKVSALQLSDLTQQIVTFSGKGSTEQKEEININTLVEEMALLLQVPIPENVNMTFNLQNDLPDVIGDPSQIRQVVLNFIINASEAIGEKQGSIKISTDLTHITHTDPFKFYAGNACPLGDYIVIEVSDTGQGMNESTKRKLFDPFFSTKTTGRGLGLSVVHGIIDAHGGALEVFSEPKKGATLKALLPCKTTIDSKTYELNKKKFNNSPRLSHSN